MEKKGLDTVDNRRKERRDNSERKADQAEGKDQNEGGDAPASKNRRKRATGEENGWMSMNKEGTGSRHAAAAEAVAAEEEEPRESHATRYAVRSSTILCSLMNRIVQCKSR